MQTSKKWIYKYRYLQIELEETKSLQEGYTEIFMRDFKDVLMNEENHSGLDMAAKEGKELIDEIKDEVKPKNNSKLAKELYRNISRKTHPDKIQDEKLNNIFKEAADAYDNHNLMELIMLSDKIGIDISSDLDETDLLMIESNCNQVQLEIDTIKSTITWQWCTYPDDDKEELKNHFIGLLTR